MHEVCVIILFSAYLGSHDVYRGRVVELAMNCYGCHVLQKALDCEEDIRLLIVSELLLGDPAQTLVNKHASHVWSKVSFDDTNFTSLHSGLDHGVVVDASCSSHLCLVSSLTWLQVPEISKSHTQREQITSGKVGCPSLPRDWFTCCSGQLDPN